MKNNLKEISQYPPYKINRVYELDGISELSVGISSCTSVFDINLDISGKEVKVGTFTKEDDFWFYVNYNTEIKAYHNGKEIIPSLGGRKRVVILEPNDEISFEINKGYPKYRFIYSKEL